MSNIRNVFFDLDGTLSDPKEGITLCIQYALTKMGQNCPSQNELAVFIGPPLRESFRKLLGTTKSSEIEKAVTLYRERYSTQGIYENTLYVDITELLADLHKDSYRLFVVTTKPTHYAKIIVKHFALDNWFEEVYGTGLDGSFDNKVELIKHILGNLALKPEETVMIGDRKEDIAAGQINGTKTIGVTYGHGSQSEIINAAPDCICNSIPEISKLIKNTL